MACLLIKLEIGILIGIGINMMFILYHAARPKITIEVLKVIKQSQNNLLIIHLLPFRFQSSGGINYLMLTPDRCLIFPSAAYVRHIVTKHSTREALPVVIDCSHIYGADYTAATAIEALTKDFAVRQQLLFFYNLKPSVSTVFEGLAHKDFIVYYNLDELDELLKTSPYVGPNARV